jgi:hypothetical protein
MNTITRSIILTDFLNEILTHGDNHAEFKVIFDYSKTEIEKQLVDSANALNIPLFQIKVLRQILKKALVEVTYLVTLQTYNLIQIQGAIQKLNILLSQAQSKIVNLTDTISKINDAKILLVGTLDLDYVLFIIKNIGGNL